MTCDISFAKLEKNISQKTKKNFFVGNIPGYY